MDHGSGIIKPNPLLLDLEYLHSIAEQMQPSVTASASAASAASASTPMSLDVQRIADIISRLSILIASDQKTQKFPETLQKDLKVINTALIAKTDWNEAETRAGLPDNLKQGIATCINILQPYIPKEVLRTQTFHESVLKTAIAKKKSSENLSPRGCVRQYCLDILREGCLKYKQHLYLLRQSSSVISGEDEKPNIIITYTKKNPPDTLDEVGHVILYWHKETNVWKDNSGSDQTWPSIDAYIRQNLPGRLGLYAPSEREISDYVDGYYATRGYSFNQLKVDETHSQ